MPLLLVTPVLLSYCFHGNSIYGRISTLYNQYGCSSFSPLAFVNGQPWSTRSDRMLRCLLSIIAVLISSALMQYGMFMYASIVSMVMHMVGISLSLFVL